MITTAQTILHNPEKGQHGNCLSAVLSSLLELPISKIPVFANPETWVKDLNEWLKQFGLAYYLVTNLPESLAAYGIKELYHEIAGTTERSNEVLHACVALNGKIIHDPHPSDAGLKEIVSYGLFVLLEPWKATNYFSN